MKKVALALSGGRDSTMCGTHRPDVVISTVV